MIEEIIIDQLGVIGSARLPLGSGFTAVTGETGAGKTMVVTALNLLMGARSDASLVRHGAADARVAGAIVTDDSRVAELVTDAGGVIEDGELLLSRSVSAEGRSRATVGGVRAPAQTLQSISEYLFTLHGQNDQIRLTSKRQQQRTLDRFGGADLVDAVAAYENLYRAHKDLLAEHAQILETWEARRQETERLKQEIAEISAIEPVAGEDITLKERIEVLSNTEQIRESLAEALGALSAESGEPYATDAAQLIQQAESALARIESVDSGVREILPGLRDALAIVQDTQRDIARRLSDLDGDSEAELAAAQQRLHALGVLQRDYGPELADVIAYEATANHRLFELEQDDARVSKIDAEVHESETKLREQAALVTGLRTRAAGVLSERVTAEFGALALGQMQFVAVLETSAQLQAHGAEDVEFRVASYPGDTLRPVGKGTSGGELSRVMLALEVVIAGVDPVPTFVFDEIDAGIGGAAAIEVGKRLARLAQTSQVIVVTHLAQVAAFANNHVRVVKDATGDYSESSLQQLSGVAREREMARLLSGLDQSESALEHARELLRLAEGK